MRCRGWSSRAHGARRCSITLPDTAQSYDAVDLLHIPLRANGARPADRRRAQHPRADRAQRAGDSSRHLRGDVPAAQGDRVQHRGREGISQSDIRHPRGRRGNGGVRRRSSRRPHARRLAPAENGLPEGPFLLYGGRIDPGKGCDQLLDFFETYKEQGGPATLVLMGAKLMPLPNVPWVRYAGLLSEADRLRALEAATIVVVPSPFESLSLLALEGMAVGNPVLCNAHADVLVDHCRRSNAGLFYSTREEFVECTHLLLADRDLRERMGRNGKTYVDRQLLVERDHGQIRQADRGASEGMNTTLVRRVVFAAIFLVDVRDLRDARVDQRRASRAARDRRRSRLRCDRVQRLAGARLRLRVERRELAQALRRHSQIPAAAHSTVRVLSHHLSAAGDAVSPLGGLCGHRTETSPRGASSTAASRPAPSRRQRSSPRSSPECRQR